MGLMENPQMLYCPVNIAFMLWWIYFKFISTLELCFKQNGCGISVTRQLSHSDDANITSLTGNKVVEAESSFTLAGWVEAKKCTHFILYLFTYYNNSLNENTYCIVCTATIIIYLLRRTI